MGSKIGKDNELCYLSFKNKKQKVLDTRFKGYGGQSEWVCIFVITNCHVQIYVSKEMRTKVILEFMCINYTDAFIDYYMMN